MAAAGNVGPEYYHFPEAQNTECRCTITASPLKREIRNLMPEYATYPGSNGRFTVVIGGTTIKSHAVTEAGLPPLYTGPKGIEVPPNMVAVVSLAAVAGVVGELSFRCD